jgi:hypothetical protein
VLDGDAVDVCGDSVEAGDNENVGRAPNGGLPANAKGGDGIGLPFPGVGALFCMISCDDAGAAVKGLDDVVWPNGLGGLPPLAGAGAVKGLPVFPPPNCPNGLAATGAGLVENADTKGEGAAGAGEATAAGFEANADTSAGVDAAGLGAEADTNPPLFAGTAAGAEAAGAGTTGATAGCCENRNWGASFFAEFAADDETRLKVCFFAQGQQSDRTIVLPFKWDPRSSFTLLQTLQRHSLSTDIFICFVLNSITPHCQYKNNSY